METALPVWGQSVHATSPTESLKVPDGHAVKGPPSGPVKPGSAWQAVLSTLAGDEFEFAGQEAHGALPGLLLKVPSMHAEQGPPSGPVKPAGHRPCASGAVVAGTQWPIEALAMEETVLEGHAVHGELPAVPL